MRYRGIVQKGDGAAARQGFPTVNIAIRGENATGIFAARVIVDGKSFAAAAYIGPPRKILEAHLLDFSGDLYGKEIEIELLEKIRDDEQFADSEALRQAIAADIAKIRQRL